MCECECACAFVRLCIGLCVSCVGCRSVHESVVVCMCLFVIVCDCVCV